MEKIESVLFDWGGVLIDDPAPGLMAFCARALEVSVAEYIEAHERHGEALQKGAIEEEVFWQRVCADLRRAAPDERSLWGRAFRAVYAPREEIFALAEQLRERDYNTALLSNTEAAAMDFFLELNYKMFDALTFSCAEGAVKPEREIYEAASRKLPTGPPQCVLIDDKPIFIEGALEAGMKGIVYQTPAQVKKELAELGVHIE
ncbi:MAG: HAD family phosphatase [Sedimentisphaerales bacterium]|nr:HAD family phosphatase [Sedimentisphaerales bacterium]